MTLDVDTPMRGRTEVIGEFGACTHTHTSGIYYIYTLYSVYNRYIYIIYTYTHIQMHIHFIFVCLKSWSKETRVPFSYQLPLISVPCQDEAASLGLFVVAKQCPGVALRRRHCFFVLRCPRLIRIQFGAGR